MILCFHSPIWSYAGTSVYVSTALWQWGTQNQVPLKPSFACRSVPLSAKDLISLLSHLIVVTKV